MRVGLVAASDPAVVRFVAGVDVRMLLAVRTVGEATIATFELAAERLFTCNIRHNNGFNDLICMALQCRTLT